MTTRKTPGVYIEEISKLPASVAEVETAIPAFIGYTASASRKGKSLLNKPTRIKSLLDFERYFGSAPNPNVISVNLDSANSVESVSIQPRFYLYDSVRMFYANGGGDCYIVAVNTYTDDDGDTNAIDKDELLGGLTALVKQDEPTLIVIPDSVLLANASHIGEIHQAALAQCKELMDRFAILDIKDGDEERTYDEEDIITVFRNNVGANNLKYGTSYYPWIQTTLSFDFHYSDVKDHIVKGGANVSLSSISEDPTYADAMDQALDDVNTKLTSLTGANHSGSSDKTYTQWFESNTTPNKAQIQHWGSVIRTMIINILNLRDGGSNTVANSDILTKVNNRTKVDSALHEAAQTLSKYDYGYADLPNSSGNNRLGIITEDGGGAVTDFTNDHPFAGAPDYAIDKNQKDLSIYGEGDSGTNYAANSAAAFRSLFEKVLSILNAIVSDANNVMEQAEENLTDTNPVYSQIVAAIEEEAVILPPSGAMAGIYAYVDNTKGVWKAPANVSVSAVVGPSVTIDNNDQDDLNVDTTAGKSINAIRAFIGKGTLVWGARTLAGNSNEWRYIPVRRLYNMVEESLKKSTSWAVFESNDANTWIRIRAQIENYLTRLWRQGALAGATPEEAYIVRVGLGETMDAQDILEGRMNIEVEMAAVRPAEFITIKFSHKLQES